LAGLQHRERLKSRQISPGGELCHLDTTDLIECLHHGVADARGCDDCGGTAVGEDVCHLRRGEMPVDRRDVPSRLVGGQERLEHGRAVIE
jgi:hypothetical protein